MTANAKESTATVAEEANPVKYRALIEALRRRQRDTYGLVPSRYWRWLSGVVPDVVRFLVENRDLAAALHEDAIRYELENGQKK